MRKISTLIFILVSLASLVGLSVAQCTGSSQGTTCTGPLTVSPPSGNTTQSSIILVDIGQPVPQPAAGQYTLTIANGVLQESDNNGAYHTLVGPQGNPGINGTNGTNGQNATISIGSVVTGSPVAVTNTGTPTQAILNFTIPAGQPGAPGPAGPPGIVVGRVVTLNYVWVTCPKGKGTVQGGFTIKNCTIAGTVASIQ